VTAFHVLSAFNAEYLQYKGACHDSQKDPLDAPLYNTKSCSKPFGLWSATFAKR